MRVLVSGGAGYIGSHTVVQLVAAGHDVLIVDNFGNSKPTVVNRLEALTDTHLPVHSFDLRDHDKTEHLFANEQIDAVIHFAGLKAVGESVEMPLEYYENNLVSTFSLVRRMRLHQVKKLVFSSSATVYGHNTPPLVEDMPTAATNPYGWTKVMIEQILRDVAAADPTLRIALLRYFNPVGAHVSGTIGEDPQGIPNNLMPFIAQVAVGRRDKLLVFGDDYPTPTAPACATTSTSRTSPPGHLAALDRWARSMTRCRRGTSARATARASSRCCTPSSGPSARTCPRGRRAPGGDLPSRSPTRAAPTARLGWTAERTMDDMCVDQWRWQSANPHGYPDA